ncbi:MAG: DNA translocase FtsK 4TM domain-containing protein [Proteobacteria bacterium]|nr:DNA translocase FtsK 4TM domain-containing protein [Pseudomonadota bacterium]
MEFSKKDIMGVLFVVLAIFTFLSLVTYNSTDQSFNNTTVTTLTDNSDPSAYAKAVSGSIEPTKNMLGLFGSYSSDLLLQIFGISSFAIPFAFLLSAIFIFFASGKSDFSYLRGGVIVALVFFLSITFHLLAGSITYGGATFSAGGMLGSKSSFLIAPYLSNVGTAIIGITVSMLLLFYLINISVTTGTTILAVGFYKGIIVPSIIAYKGIAWFVGWILSKTNRKDFPQDDELIDNAEKTINAKTTNFKVKTPAIKQKTKKLIGEDDDFEETVKRDFDDDYELPSVELLNKHPKSKTKEDLSELKATATAIQSRLRDFDVEGEVVEVSPGPVITMYEFKPAPGVKINKVANLNDDLALALGCGSIRVIAPIPGKSVIGIEVPNKARETVYIRELIDSNLFKTAEKKIPLAIGKDTEGVPYVEDLSKMPHLLVAGSTGSGKSVFINSLICSILYKFSPKEVRMIMIDPKMLELSTYEGIPHLLHPVVTNAAKAAQALKWAVREMMDRYTILASKNARSITSYNAEADEPMPYIIIIVDELADLMMVSSKDVESAITRLAQMARAAGIHLILATQRPSVDVITGLIKANFPARIAFKVASKIDSRTILDTMGAEQLLGMGDMLFLPPGTARLERLHGAFVSDEEVKRVVDFVKEQGAPDYRIQIPNDEKDAVNFEDGDEDELYDQAVNIVVETRKTSISYIQRRLGIGYNRAANIMEQMEKNGVVSAELSSGRREILMDSSR